MPTHDDADQLYKQAVEAAGRGDHFKAKELFEDALELYREVPGAERIKPTACTASPQPC